MFTLFFDVYENNHLKYYFSIDVLSVNPIVGHVLRALLPFGIL